MYQNAQFKNSGWF